MTVLFEFCQCEILCCLLCFHCVHVLCILCCLATKNALWFYKGLETGVKMAVIAFNDSSFTAFIQLVAGLIFWSGESNMENNLSNTNHSVRTESFIRLSNSNDSNRVSSICSEEPNQSIADVKLVLFKYINSEELPRVSTDSSW